MIITKAWATSHMDICNYCQVIVLCQSSFIFRLVLTIFLLGLFYCFHFHFINIRLLFTASVESEDTPFVSMQHFQLDKRCNTTNQTTNLCGNAVRPIKDHMQS